MHLQKYGKFFIPLLKKEKKSFNRVKKNGILEIPFQLQVKIGL